MKNLGVQQHTVNLNGPKMHYADIGQHCQS